ncbi:hypothetical protein FHY25_003397 [Xanthomonas arboricola]|uniref:hypothetical protein n=1 Tax=Xanthomonas TaxID=338 RepID=UPI0023E9C55A|nr:hypothetical protein [Xanthomonas sp. LMC-A-07]MCW1983340.1 hypothetical protein [Xanthomonas campestris]MCW2008695.1 hypothetical protein [Xanthomonas campestris]MEB2231762.1 hypothetical protein [Xanthomonas campestris pv. campestris]
MNKAVAFCTGSLLLVVVGMTASPSAAAQSSTVMLDCNGSDYCWAGVESPSSPRPLKYAWSFSNTAGAIFPRNCSNSSECSFYCPRGSMFINATVTVSDANNQFIGSATARALCTPQPL